MASYPRPSSLTSLVDVRYARRMSAPVPVTVRRSSPASSVPSSSGWRRSSLAECSPWDRPRRLSLAEIPGRKLSLVECSMTTNSHSDSSVEIDTSSLSYDLVSSPRCAGPYQPIPPDQLQDAVPRHSPGLVAIIGATRPVWRALMLGQLMSLLLCVMAVCNHYLSTWYQVTLPMGQSTLRYMLQCVVFTTWLSCRSGDQGIINVLRCQGLRYLALAFMDVEAGFLLMMAHQFTTLTSIQVSAVFLNHMLGDVPLTIRITVWLQQDGCPAHFSLMAQQLADKFFWDSGLDEKDRNRHPGASNNKGRHEGKTKAACESLSSAEVLRVSQDIRKRAQHCLAHGGGHFEQLWRLLDCVSIPVALALSCSVLKVRYKIVHIVGVSICLMGVGCLVWADVEDGRGLAGVVLYGCETWTLTLREEHRLRVFENKVLRKIFGAKRDEVTGEWRKLHNAELQALYSSPDIIRDIKSRCLRWAGHVACMGESRNAYRVLVGRPEGKRPLGRPRRRWEDNIKMDLREVGYDDRDWINLAQDRDRWWAYVRAAMNLRTINIRYPPQNWLHLYTDGSLISREQGAGAGVTCCLFSLHRSLGYGTTSFDGEITAISESLRNLLCHINKFKNAVILSDSKAAILSIVSKHTPSSQTAEITKMLSQLISLNKRIVFQWISSHCGILGNENADALAKKGSTATYRPVTKSTYYSVKRFIKSTYLDFNKQNLITQSQGKKMELSAS
ncbi:hypothetical protein ANN_03891 [Periplaneta americana]|uniref:RNase H type-1 domain-containing protein n=1 Tax=Periplaneta americana TaxID=6978 RepID=A0ABQ8U3J2_PERAM|nr:hypothetical protein ANN_03891 [Periplaneta americana]